MFQSSPSPKAGRYKKNLGNWGNQGRFQSSPSPKAGRYEAGALAPASSPKGVSILAQPEGRALPSCSPAASWTTSCFNPRPARRPGATCHAHSGWHQQPSRFQSSPSPKAGRYLAGQRRGVGLLPQVSILAQPEGRALPRLGARERRHPRVSILAQPEGRALRAEFGRQRPQERRVSILAQPEGRALRAARPNSARTRSSFQSSPSPKAGRYPHAAAGDAAAVAVAVSILAQPEGRALPTPPFGGVQHRGVSILAQPEGRALPPASAGAAGAADRFQSSPSPKAGRYARRSSSKSRCWRSFNPRPARRPGATRGGILGVRAERVAFQSSPSPKAGRYDAEPHLRRHRRLRFNPRPARRPGATGMVSRR